jgi:hypothetical protein
VAKCLVFFAAYAFVIMIAFAILFKYKHDQNCQMIQINYFLIIIIINIDVVFHQVLNNFEKEVISPDRVISS